MQKRENKENEVTCLEQCVLGGQGFEIFIQVWLFPSLGWERPSHHTSVRFADEGASLKLFPWCS